jgi:hypothetical protein
MKTAYPLLREGEGTFARVLRLEYRAHEGLLLVGLVSATASASAAGSGLNPPHG